MRGVQLSPGKAQSEGEIAQTQITFLCRLEKDSDEVHL